MESPHLATGCGDVVSLSVGTLVGNVEGGSLTRDSERKTIRDILREM